MILALDVGGTFIKSAVIDRNGTFNELPQVPSCSDSSAAEIIEAFHAAIAAAGKVDAVGIAIPGPFDYARGISLMEHKFRAIKGLELRNVLPELPLRFVHDANAFLLGEVAVGAVRGVVRAAGITLGTGLGAALVVDGKPVCNALGSPAENVSLWSKPFRNGVVEDHISSRALLAKYPAPDVKAIADAAKAGDDRALAVWREFGEALNEVLIPWCVMHEIGRIVLGGQIAKDYALFSAPLAHLPITTAQLGTRAALYGMTALWQ